jgi:hypothetical protein
MPVQSHIRVEYHDGKAVKVAFVPAIQCSLEQSQEYGTKEITAVLRALAKQLGVGEWAVNVVAFNAKDAYNETGELLDALPFTVEEHASGFSLTHNPSGRNHWLSDGVDVMTMEDGDDDTTLHPGTIGFTMAWSDMMNNSEGETLEAYFPDLDTEQEDDEEECEHPNAVLSDDTEDPETWYCPDCGETFIHDPDDEEES